MNIPKGQVHYLIRGARDHFLNTRTVEDGAYLKPFKKLLVDVAASASGLDRTLDLANDLFNALEWVGHRVMIANGDQRWSTSGIDEREVVGKDRHLIIRRWSPQRPTVVFIGEVAIGLTVLEMSEEVLLRCVGGKYIRESEYLAKPLRYRNVHTWTTTRELPSGRLRIGAFLPYGSVKWSMSWQETKTSTLAGAIATIVRELEKAAPDLAAKLEEADRQAEIRHREWIAAEERRKRADDRRKIEESIRESRDDLSKVIERWAAVMSIEQFFASVSDRVDALPKDQKKMMAERLSLARAFLGPQDPLEFFGKWKTPAEWYQPIYDHESDEAL